jgi:hypothetical protein
MSKNPSDKNRTPDQEKKVEDDARKTDRDRDPGAQPRKGASMGRVLEGKFVSDEDIVKNRRTA